jgi:hydroxyacylglutathione hydrolase
MAIEILKLAQGLVSTNCYLLGECDTGEAIVIDPADDAPAILSAAEQRGWTIRLVLATHAHFDHVLAAEGVKQASGAPFRLHEDDLPVLQALQLTGQLFGLALPPPPEVDSFVTAGEAIEVGAIRLNVRHTPGHTPGHVSYVLESDRVVFCGDCLFAGSIGRTDLPGGDHGLLMKSIREQLLSLPDDYTVASGHGGLTAIGVERQTNPFLVNDDGE